LESRGKEKTGKCGEEENFSVLRWRRRKEEKIAPQRTERKRDGNTEFTEIGARKSQRR
jgi:hypothetical protein